MSIIVARNECDEDELVDEYVGNIVRKLFKRKHRSHDLTPSQQWLRTVHLQACLFDKQIVTSVISRSS